MNYSFNKFKQIQRVQINTKKIENHFLYFNQISLLRVKQKSYLYINKICWNWAKNRHKQKSNKWIFKNYWLFIKNKLYFYIINNNKIYYIISF